VAARGVTAHAAGATAILRAATAAAAVTVTLAAAASGAAVATAALPAETPVARTPGGFFAAATSGDHDAVLERVTALPKVGSAAAAPS
jgi:hypothetical protein